MTISLAFGQESPGEAAFKTCYLVITPDAGSAAPVAITRFDQPPANAFTEMEATAPNLTDRALITRMSGDVALALVNPNNQSVTVTFDSIINPLIQSPVRPPTKQIELAAFHQTVKFMREIVTSLPPVINPMISIASSAPISIAAFKLRGNQVSRTPLLNVSTGNFVVPLRDGIGGPGAMVFPIFTQADGFAGSLFLVNATDTVMAGRVDLFDALGDPLAMDLNGQTTSTFRYTIAGRFLFILQPSVASFETLEQGNSSFFPSDGREVLLINSQTEWEAFYARHNPNGRPPEVDFSTRSVIVAISSLGVVCEDVEITELLPLGGHAVRVRAAERWMGSACACILIVPPPRAHIVVTSEKVLSITSEWDKIPCVPYSGLQQALGQSKKSAWPSQRIAVADDRNPL
jgi:hypothetical protein